MATSVREFKQALDTTDEIERTARGRRSGREITNPVWFVHEGDMLYLLPVSGSRSQWYRNVLKDPEIRLDADGVEWRGRALPISDPDEVREVVEKFRSKYGKDEVKKYYSGLDVAVVVPLA